VTFRSLLYLALGLALPLSAHAAKGKEKLPPAAPSPAAPSPAAPSPAAPSPAAPTPELQGTVEELMRKAKQLHDQLEYDQVLPLVQEVLKREGVPIELTLDAYVLEGSCLAIMGNPIDAEAPFRRLLRGRPDFELSEETPPKIISVFRKVQAEERAIAEQMEALTRRRVVSGMALLGEHPENLRGGRPVYFDYLLKDPTLAAQTVRVQYRRKGEPAYSSLALMRDDTGRWSGQIPGEWTANEGGVQLEMYIEALDKKGALVAAGTAAEPLRRDIAEGQVDRSAPPPMPAWSMWVGAGTTAALALAGAGFGAGFSVVQEQYVQQAERARTDPQPGAELVAKERLGSTLGWTANGLFIASGVSALVTVVAGVFFVDWEGRADEEAPRRAPAAVPGAAPAAAR
jgi:hypothetical protein